MSKASYFFLFLLPVLLLFLKAAAKPCPSCGSTAVPFPLSTSPSCGDPSYTVRCASNSSLFFDTLTSSYSIISISPSSQALTIGIPPIPASRNSPSVCTASDSASGGLTLNSSAPFNISSSNTIFFLNCTSSILASPLNCSSSSPCHAYLNSSAPDAAGAAAACRSSPICCSFRAGGSSTAYNLRTTPTGCSAYRSFVDLDTGSTPVAEWGSNEGVQLEWADPPEPACSSQVDCDEITATCREDPTSTSASTAKRCFCNDEFRWDSIAGLCVKNLTDCADCGSTNNAPLIAGVVSGVSAAALVSAVGLLLYRRNRRIRRARERLAREREEILNANNPGGRSAKIFSGRELRRATSNFSRDNLLGSGGYGDVYRGSLPDGTPIAVKCAKLGSTKSTDQVLNEVRILSQVNHRFLVRLLGCCVDLAQPLMVYEFIPNGTLFDHLARGSLSWRGRLAVAHQTAEGLTYLHSSAVPPIYHRDVKSSNILLDEKLNAKVSDFGLSRLAEADLSHVTTCAQGTLGYLDPEYYRNYQLTDKSDVYSFGVVLLELLTSKKAIDFGRGPEDANLAVYVQTRVDEERLMDVLDDRLKTGATQVELDSMKALGFLAMGCLEEKRQNRPSMKEVSEEIEYIISIVDGSATASNQDYKTSELL